MIFEFAQKHYFFEFERRAHLNRELNFTTGLITVYGAVITFGFRFVGFEDNLETHLTQVFLVSIGLALNGLAYFVQHFGFGYEYIAKTESYHSYYEEIKSKQSARIKPLQKTDEWFSVSLAEKYSKAASINSDINDRKATLQLRANQFILCALGAALWIAGIGMVGDR